MKKLLLAAGCVMIIQLAHAQSSVNGSFNVNVNINEGTSVKETETTTTTTTTSTSTTTGGQSDVYVMPGYSGPVGCSWPMNDGEFSEVKSSITSKTFEDSKLTIAKQVTRSRCMTASQVKELAALMDFEQTKLDFAKYAYDYTFDIGNYYKVNDVFDFETSIDELNRYITSRN
jgi:hypothetical protein